MIVPDPPRRAAHFFSRRYATCIKAQNGDTSVALTVPSGKPWAWVQFKSRLLPALAVRDAAP